MVLLTGTRLDYSMVLNWDFLKVHRMANHLVYLMARSWDFPMVHWKANYWVRLWVRRLDFRSVRHSVLPLGVELEP